MTFFSPFFRSNLLACLVLLASCTPKKTDPTINVAILSPPETLDPRFTTSTMAQRISQLVFAPLFTIENDLSVKPFLAKSIVLREPLHYVITLRNDIFFHNGEQVQASDLAYTLATLGDEDVRSPKDANFNYIKEVRALNSTQTLVVLNRVQPGFFIDLAGISVVSEKQCKDRSQKCRHEHLGNGPFKVKSFDPATETYVLEPFAKWYEGKPPQALTIRVVRNFTTRLLEIVHGKSDFLSGNMEPSILDVLKKYEHKLTIERMPGLDYTYLAMNVRGPNESSNTPEKKRTQRALATPMVRRAIAHALNLDKILEYKMKGLAKRASGIIPSEHWAKDPDLKPPQFDPKLSNALLDEAGFKNRGNTLGRFSVEIATTPHRFRQSLALIYAQHLNEVGIKARIRIKDWPALYQDMKKGRFEMFSAQWMPIVEPDMVEWVFHSRRIPSSDNAGGNRGGYLDPVMDELIDQARATMDQAIRAPLYKHIEARLLETLPYIPLWFEDQFVVISKRVEGYEMKRSGSMLGLRKATLIKDKDPS